MSKTAARAQTLPLYQPKTAQAYRYADCVVLMLDDLAFVLPLGSANHLATTLTAALQQRRC